MKTSIGERKGAKCKRIASEWKSAHKVAHRYRPWGKRVDDRTRRAYAKMHRKGREYSRTGCGSVLDLYPAVIDE